MSKSEIVLKHALEHNLPVCHVAWTGLWAWQEWQQPILQPQLGPWPTPASFKLADAVLNRLATQTIATDFNYDQWLAFFRRDK